MEDIIMARGSIGANCSTIIHRRQKPVPCSCPKCSHYRIVDGVKYCMMSGDILQRCKTSCLYYSGPFIYRKKPKKKSKSRSKSLHASDKKKLHKKINKH